MLMPNRLLLKHWFPSISQILNMKVQIHKFNKILVKNPLILN